MGLVPKAISMGPLDLGTWVHEALQNWYLPGLKRGGDLADIFDFIAECAIKIAESNGAPEHILDKASELRQLGLAMMAAYQDKYGDDPTTNVLAVELPLSFTIPDYKGEPIAEYALKPDMVFRTDNGVWLMEHKTAASIRTGHLTIDGQARPYGVLAARALVKAGVIKSESEFKGIMYNFMRKGLPDERPTDAKGMHLNQNGSVSKRQPLVQFVRHPVLLTRPAKRVTLNRLRADVNRVATLTNLLHSGAISGEVLSKTPHHSCPKFCDYFPICEMEENGLDITQAQKDMYTRQNPYEYSETTDEPQTFEMG